MLEGFDNRPYYYQSLTAEYNSPTQFVEVDKSHPYALFLLQQQLL